MVYFQKPIYIYIYILGNWGERYYYITINYVTSSYLSTFFFFSWKYLQIRFSKAVPSKVYQKLDWYAYIYFSYTYTYPSNFWYTFENQDWVIIESITKVRQASCSIHVAPGNFTYKHIGRYCNIFSWLVFIEYCFSSRWYNP